MAHDTRPNDCSDIVRKITAGLSETRAADLIGQLVNYIGAESAQELYDETLRIESAGGMMTHKGDRRRTPGGVFINLVKDKVSYIERELLFPSGKLQFTDTIVKEFIEKLTGTQLLICRNRIDDAISRLGQSSHEKQAYLLQIKQMLLSALDRVQSEEASKNLAEIKETVVNEYDDTTRASLLARITQLEELAKAKMNVRDEIEATEVERERMRIQLEAEERRMKNKFHLFEYFIARESAASIIGSVLLLLIAIALLIGMFIGRVDNKIIENCFLVLLGYFFGQSVQSKSVNRHTENSRSHLSLDQGDT